MAMMNRKEQTMRLIDADALIESIKNTADLGGWIGEALYQIKQVAIKYIGSAPSIDIVRCKDCKHWVYNFNGCARNPCTDPWYATDFCNYGERESE